MVMENGTLRNLIFNAFRPESTDLIGAPRQQRNLGTVWVPIGLAGAGTPHEIAAPDGGRWPGRTAAIPFIDPKKAVPKA